MNAREKARLEIEHRILNGYYQLGQRLTELEIANALSLGRGPVREALQALAHEGLLEFFPNRGAVIKEADPVEIKSLFDIRIALSPLIAEAVIDTVRNADITELKSQVDEMDTLAVPESVDEYLEANIRFHNTIYELSGKRRIVELDYKLGKELRIYRRRGLISGGGLAQSNVEHRQIVAALEKRDVALFSRELEQHILSGRDRFLQTFQEHEQGDRSMQQARA